ncbi:MAG: DMT family protein [Spirochaetes bacterium]|nr:DMT family protein [Spirochaetota bacterium]
MRTIILLIFSNLFMTTAWYGHLKYKSTALWLVILTSWLIALPEYALQVPANRFGHGQFTAPQLKIIQEVISITIFLGFCLLYLREPFKWNYVLSLICIIMAVVFAFWNLF